MTIGIGVIGYGYWGPNLVRNFAAQAGARMVAVADTGAGARAAVNRQHPGVRIFDDAADLLRAPEVDAVVIATPVATHYALARDAIARGKHILVEKPLCASSAEAEDLIARAAAADVVLMIDHTFLFTGAVQSLSEIVGRGELGKLCYFDSTRVNLGLFQPDVNCLWDLAPHDLSIIDHLIDDELVDLDISGYCHLNHMRPDMVYLTLHYADNLVAHLNLSWMSPVKIRRFTIGGAAKMLIWDDLDQDQKIKIYDHGIEVQPEEQRSVLIPEYRIGDIFSPRIPRREALAGVAQHFLAVIAGETASIMDGAKGLRIVKVLEAAQAKLDVNLREIEVQRMQKRERSVQ